MKCFVGLYYVLIIIAHACAMPFLFILSFKQKYRVSLKKRFLLPDSIEQEATGFQLHWLHACSFGEVKSLQSIIESLQQQLRENEKILLTTTTQTGFNLANKLYPNCIVRYLPFETLLPFWLHNIRLKSLTLVEAELWLMPLFCAKAKGAKTLLINARISKRSFPKYQKFDFFYRRIFSLITKIFCQTPADKMCLEALGARNVVVLGNLKLAEIPQISTDYTAPKQPLWIVASTHSKAKESEEVWILQAIIETFFSSCDSFSECLESMPRFLFAPRHPERFLEVESQLNAILESHALPHLIKTSEVGVQDSLNAPFILLDSLGELHNLYKIAQGVILGGSFLQGIGGHNPIEAAFFHTKLISGPYIFNQKALFASIQNYTLCKIQNLPKALQKREVLKGAKITKKLKLTKIIQAICCKDSENEKPKTPKN
ncbi:lipid IV(A) 3-deoxy-D-manno-octulosonic acid transferase [Helicobacter sp. MIT 05-5294]|uniref:lipid IV(A) 3-deoxy-D-manno-octulosonic acid transferase n=1 Tax=Helicobacter sp. MIT 05-5294 TaxID=1548150 RepID=UPI00051F91E0|nr:lipid IV(A) 3-deoxy-D-manno-octulosonic acid transferase [Helicobacter sp. MIT 05-5294]TLD87029.1 3-deoxy-D-manno-octulosonic acid transferase [Helicobacter sp. MIT 05-5294]